VADSVYGYDRFDVFSVGLTKQKQWRIKDHEKTQRVRRYTVRQQQMCIIVQNVLDDDDDG
jgi:hypothetical protein